MINDTLNDADYDDSYDGKYYNDYYADECGFDCERLHLECFAYDCYFVLVDLLDNNDIPWHLRL